MPENAISVSYTHLSFAMAPKPVIVPPVTAVALAVAVTPELDEMALMAVAIDEALAVLWPGATPRAVAPT